MTASPEPKKQKTGDLASRFKSEQTIEYPHECFGVRCMATTNDWILTGARRQIKAFRKENGKWICFKDDIGKRFGKHGDMRDLGGPTSLASFHDRLLIAGDTEGHINIWKMNESFAYVDWLEWPSTDPWVEKKDRAITSILVLDESTFLAASLDGNLYCWNLDIACDLTFVKNKSPKKPHGGAAIRSMAKLSDNRVATGSEDSSIKIWKTTTDEVVPIRSWKCEHTLMPNEGFVVRLAVTASKLLSIHELHEGRYIENSKIFVWDTESWNNEKVLQGGNKYVINSVVSYKDVVVSSSLEGAMVWNPETWDCEAVIDAAKGSSVVCGDEIAFGRGSLRIYKYLPK